MSADYSLAPENSEISSLFNVPDDQQENNIEFENANKPAALLSKVFFNFYFQ